MTASGARAWLPKDAFSLEAVGACLSGPLSAWAERWFVRTPAAVAAVRAGEPTAAAPAPQSLNIEGVNAALELSGRGKRRLLEAALDIDLADQPLSEGDRRLLDAFAQKIAQDLVSALDETLSIDDDGATGAPVVSTIAVGGHDVFSLLVSDHVLAPLIKARVVDSCPPARPLIRRIEALKRTKLNAHGFLGRAELGLDELESLNVGDVLVLDRALAEPVELRLAGRETAMARGRLCQDGGLVAIQL
jgi:flagellar motor switch/type III secretory pathway protein FliN